MIKAIRQATLRKIDSVLTSPSITRAAATVAHACMVVKDVE